MFRQIGQVLRDTRERRGLSLPDVQTQTNIRRRYLEAMENGDFQLIPGEVYARGFLRSYARFLALDETELLNMYREALAQMADTGPVSQPGAPIVSPTNVARRPGEAGGGPTFRPRRAPRLLWPVTVLLVAVSAVAIGLYYLGSGLGLPADEPDVTGSEPGTETPQQLPPPPPPEPEPEPPRLVVSRLPDDPARPNYVLFAVQQADDEPIDIKVATGATCWWRATVDGEVVGEGTLAAGDELQWSFRQNFVVHLGNPQDITVHVGGEFTEKIAAQQPRYVVVEQTGAP